MVFGPGCDHCQGTHRDFKVLGKLSISSAIVRHRHQRAPTRSANRSLCRQSESPCRPSKNLTPPTNSSGLPFLGIATKDLDGLGFTAAGFRLTGFSGPLGGNMAIFQTPAFGAPVVYFRSNDGTDPLVDYIPSAVGRHDHYNYGFTKAVI